MESAIIFKVVVSHHHCQLVNKLQAQEAPDIHLLQAITKGRVSSADILFDLRIARMLVCSVQSSGCIYDNYCPVQSQENDNIDCWIDSFHNLSHLHSKQPFQ